MKIKYLILDFGKVLAYPVTGDWFIIPSFYKYVNKDKLNEGRLKKSMIEIGDMLGKKLKDEKEEFELFKEFYKKSLINSGYTYEDISKNVDKNIDDISRKCAYDFVYNNDKYRLYDDVVESLERFSKEYTLICLSDNWPSGRRYMKDMLIYDLFDKVYISSDFGYTKYEKIFFNHPINDFKIKKNEAIFVDDSMDLMSIAKEKGLIPYLMDRDNNVYDIKHDIRKISKLEEI